MALVDGGDLVARAIKQEGVDTIFTLCGGHVQAIYDSCLDEKIKVIDVRHEQVAGHAAEGWSRATRKCGVAVVTAGPGVTDCVTAIANAWHNKSPVLIIGGRSPLARFEMGALQDMDHTEILRPITKFAKCVHQTERIPEFISMAFRAAMTGRPSRSPRSGSRRATGRRAASSPTRKSWRRQRRRCARPNAR